MMPMMVAGGGMMMFLVLLFWVLIIIGVIMLVVWLLKRRNIPGHSEESAIDILKMRYAKGEINKEEYERMKKDISQGG